MLKIKRKYHFYAAHRNEKLTDKCRSLHGHQYNIEVDLEFKRIEDGICIDDQGDKCTFAYIDSIINPIIESMDHAILINKHDPLLKYLKLFEEEQNEKMKMVIFDDVTSVENLSILLFGRIYPFLPIKAIHVQETKSSIVTFEL